MNKARLTALCHTISKENGLTFNSVMLYYFLESILKKLVQGKYGGNLVFKGGFLLSNVVGIESRSTMDIDFLLRNMQVTEEKVLELLTESLEEKEGDEIHYEIMNIAPIKEQDQYGGYRASILCRFENIRQVIPLDIATGDVITPHPIQYSFASIFGNEAILIKAYPIETMLAEKLQTIYARGFLNSRNKGYYDLHILYRLRSKEIDMPTLARACERTFHYRKTEFDVA
ncbi:MAG: nucleotidyl transferase AbiEii/AbiGii toxin family protein [Sphaerochaeta sp.]|nr:nucleotidyl transferase AbiEii/AbiGii toxin family protein [Sphaerochaeta sp.]